MNPQTLVPLLVQVSLILLVTAVGLQGRWRDLTLCIREPRLLLRALVAVNVVVPLVAVLCALVLPVAPMIKAGIVLMAVSPMAPFVPGKMLKAGAENTYVVGLYVALILAAVIVVPLTVAIISALAPGEITIPIGVVAWFVFTSVLIPLGAGLALGELLPAAAARLAKIATVMAYLILIPVVCIVLYKAGGALLALIGNGVVLAIVVTVCVGLAAGHLLGGPEPSHRAALANAAVTRHPGIAGLIAHRNFDDPRVMLTVLLFLLTGLLMSGIYSAWVSRRISRAGATPGLTG